MWHASEVSSVHPAAKGKTFIPTLLVITIRDRQTAFGKDGWAILFLVAEAFLPLSDHKMRASHNISHSDMVSDMRH